MKHDITPHTASATGATYLRRRLTAKRWQARHPEAQRAIKQRSARVVAIRETERLARVQAFLARHAQKEQMP